MKRSSTAARRPSPVARLSHWRFSPRSPGLADVLLLGNKDQVRADAARFNADISKFGNLDYRVEAANQRLFAGHFDGHPHIWIPAVDAVFGPTQA